MFDLKSIQKGVCWRFIRSHCCTVAVALSFNALWRVPRDAFRFGPLTYGLLHALATLLVALPPVLLELSVGQLSQQDAVGVWRAVPFFKGVGYIKLLVSFLCSSYTVIYVGVTANVFLYTARNSSPLNDTLEMENIDTTTEINSGNCSDSFWSNVTTIDPLEVSLDQFVGVSFIMAVVWIAMPFILYSAVKSVKRAFYVLGPIVLVLLIITISSIGDSEGFRFFARKEDWESLLEPYIWVSAITQALMSTQVANGYVVILGDTLYSSMNVVWTSLIFVGINLLASWLSMIFWCAVLDPAVEDTSLLSVLVRTYLTTKTRQHDTAWPVVVFLTLIVSGIITLITLLHPLYDRYRRLFHDRWRSWAMGTSMVGLAISALLLSGNEPVISIIDEVAVPLLITFSFLLEIIAFGFVYGWKSLMEDIQFLIGSKLSVLWPVGWFVAPTISSVFAIWWMARVALDDENWSTKPWRAASLIATLIFVTILFITFAIFAVARQVNYDAISKLRSSFKPARHWGPRDPITHYYWLARREDASRGLADNTTYTAWQIGQLSGRTSLHSLPDSSSHSIPKEKLEAIVNEDPRQWMNRIQRANSDDWFWMEHRRQYLRSLTDEFSADNRVRSKSVDWARVLTGLPKQKVRTLNLTTLDIH